MEFKIKDREYVANKLTVFQQFHVSRKLLPIVSEFIGKIGVKNLNQQMDMDTIVNKVIPPLAEYLSGVSEDDCNSIIYPCLSVVKIKQGTATTPIFDNKSKMLMFQDITMKDMITITFYVIKDSLSDFFQELQDGVPKLEQ